MKAHRALPALFLTLFAVAASAQTIYKQVDEDGRVSFTDQPRAEARTLTSYQLGQGARHDAVVDSDSEALGEILRGRGLPPEVMPTRPFEGRYETRGRTPRAQEQDRNVADVAYRPAGEGTDFENTNVTGSPVAAPARTRGGWGEVERAVANYAPLNSLLAAQVDANEAARRASQAKSKVASTPVLVVQPAPPAPDRLTRQGNLEFMYALWILTFILLGGGLLYFGWRVLELVLGSAFPDWHIGAR